MIEELLAALADGAEDAAPRPGIGTEEIADILWLAARVDPAGPRAPAVAPGDFAGLQPPAADPPAPEAATVPGGPADGQPAVRIFPASAPDPAGKPADDGAGRRGSPLRLPRAASLADPLALMRALRPVGRRSIGGPGEELDEQLTVERSIERMVPTPVLRPAESRWLDLALVVDTHHSMLLWADLVDELRRVLTRSGVFRDVRTWRLTGTGSGATPMLTRGRSGAPRNPLELADPAGRRLILVLSDTVAGGWREASVQGVLRHWCTHNAVAVLNVLPERLWTRGAVRPVPFAVRADRPAAATRSWQRAATARRSRAGRGRAPDVVPVVGVTPGSLARLVRVVAGDGRWRRLACLRLDAEPDPAPGTGTGTARVREAPSAGPYSALEVVERFRASASPTAQQLAAHLAAVPLTLPVMNLVRRSLLHESEHGHLAEVALGGLFAPWDHERDAEEVEFAFLPGVREALLGSQLRGDVAAVRELVRRRVWEYMSRSRGTGPDFSATRVTDGREGRRGVTEGTLPFAARPPQDPGLADRVVRVRYDPMPEPQEVGTLLTPRLVLTVGDAPLPSGTAAWVRAGDREVACRAVWADDALPRVFLLLADEDLVDVASWSGMTPWAPAEPQVLRVRVDGVTDQGRPVALTGEAVPHGGDRNGELVRLSPEPEAWTHFRGAPVSHEGALLGVVHGVWPDRMVFLSGHALLEQPGFRAAMAEHGQTRPAGTFVCLAVQPAADGVHGIGSSPHAEAVELLRGLIADTGLTERLAGSGPGAPLLLLLEGSGALGTAGRLLSGLPDAMARFADRKGDDAVPALDVAVAAGPMGPVLDDGDLAGLPTSEAARLVRHPAMADRRRLLPGSLAVALSQPVYEALGEKVGPTATRALVPLGGETEGWLCTDPEELGVALAEADGSQDAGVAWSVCGRRSVEDLLAPCRGVRLPGHDVCLAHLGPDEEHAYLGTLGPGSPVDFRGTTFKEGLLQRLLAALRESRAQPVTLGEAAFDHATFVDDWNEGGVEFLARASFTGAVFAGRARLGDSTFTGRVSFYEAVFLGVGDFDRSRFHAGADFRRAQFRGLAGFSDSAFLDEVSFDRAVMELSADLNGMRVAGGADFSRAVFCGLAGLSGARFEAGASFFATTWEQGLVSTGALFGGPVDFRRARFLGRVRLEQLSLPEDPELAFEDVPGRWTIHRRPDDTWDIRLLGTGEQ
ncbi:SAV_2336 N-terminal domain-related protein [Streptomyces erythrochromogenes]|uniref:SAV_2336 N-terminal domain-related protein n=1 Tax=Streptomyces erythrochromogenes TaxID=285574 RepID=UPI00367F2452